MKSIYKILLFAPVLVLTSCGYGLKETYNGIPYNSTVFEENYYNVWNDQINPYSEKNKINQQSEVRHLEENEDQVFVSMDEGNFRKNDNNWASYAYGYDKTEPEDKNLKAYGPSVKLSKYDDSFKYGLTSKLFDGQMFCNGDFQQSRTQVEPNNSSKGKGLGVLLSKESNDASYFMMNFKCSVVKKDDQNLPRASSNVRLYIGLYTKNSEGYSYIPVTFDVNDVPTNSSDGSGETRKNNYICFGFSLKNLTTERLIGFSIQYEKISDTYSDTHPTEETLHAIMLYEVSFPYTTWH